MGALRLRFTIDRNGQTNQTIKRPWRVLCVRTTRPPKCKRPRESPRPSREPINRYPVKVNHHYPDNTATNQVTLRRVAPRPADPPLVPERQSFRRRNGPGGIRTLTCDLDRVLCCHYTTGPRTKAYFSFAKLRTLSRYLFKRSFVLKLKRFAGDAWAPFPEIFTSPVSTATCDSIHV